MEKKSLSKHMKIVSVFFLFGYGLMTLIILWTNYPDFGKFIKNMARPTLYLFAAYSVLVTINNKGQKPFFTVDEKDVYRKLTKISSYILGITVVMLGVILFLINTIFERRFFAGLTVLLSGVLISIPFFGLPWAIYYSVGFIKNIFSSQR